MDVKNFRLADLKPYEKNPRKNDSAVDAVANSIKQFGFKVPIVIDSDNVIVCGHTRYKAAQMLGLESVPCVVADDLSPEQIKAFRLADNKTAELAAWDFELLDAELSDIAVDMNDFGFDNLSQPNFAVIPNLMEKSDKETRQKKLKCPKCRYTADIHEFKRP